MHKWQISLKKAGISIPIGVTVFFILSLISSQLLVQQGYAYRECTNAASGCAGQCGINNFADVTTNGSGGYSCSCPGIACGGTQGQSCGNTSTSFCESSTIGFNNCGQGGVCGSLFCCDTAQKQSGWTQKYKCDPTTKACVRDDTGGNTTDPYCGGKCGVNPVTNNGSTGPNSNTNGSTTVNTAASVCANHPGAANGTWTCTSSDPTDTTGNLVLCKGTTPGNTQSCNGIGCTIDTSSTTADDKCNNTAVVTVITTGSSCQPKTERVCADPRIADISSCGNVSSSHSVAITTDASCKDTCVDQGVNSNCSTAAGNIPNIIRCITGNGNQFFVKSGHYGKYFATGPATGYCAAWESCSDSANGGNGGCVGNTDCNGTGSFCAAPGTACGGQVSEQCSGAICCPARGASVPVLGVSTSILKPVDTTLTVQMNAYADTIGTNLLTQAKENKNLKVLAAKIYTATDKVNYTGTNGSDFTYSNPNFNMSAIPTGKYKVYLHVDKYLNKVVTDISGNNLFTFPFFKPLTTQFLRLNAGDVAPLPHGDNYVDIQDYNYVLGCLGLKTTDVNSSTCPDPKHADLDENGVVNSYDLQIVRDHFGESGDSPFPPQFTCVTDPSCVSDNNSMQVCALKCSITTPNQ